jgi:hypothetical protein
MPTAPAVGAPRVLPCRTFHPAAPTPLPPALTTPLRHEGRAHRMSARPDAARGRESAAERGREGGSQRRSDGARERVKGATPVVTTTPLSQAARARQVSVGSDGGAPRLPLRPVACAWQVSAGSDATRTPEFARRGRGRRRGMPAPPQVPAGGRRRALSAGARPRGRGSRHRHQKRPAASSAAACPDRRRAMASGSPAAPGHLGAAAGGIGVPARPCWLATARPRPGHGSCAEISCLSCRRCRS